MKADKIQQIIKDYNALHEHTLDIIEKLEKLDGKMYNTCRGIDSIEFDEKEVCVACDNSYFGDFDTHYFSFPTSFLSMSDEQLQQAIVVEKEKREEAERIKKEKEAENKRLEHERYEKDMLKRLKKKYENSN